MKVIDDKYLLDSACGVKLCVYDLAFPVITVGQGHKPVFRFICLDYGRDDGEEQGHRYQGHQSLGPISFSFFFSFTNTHHFHAISFLTTGGKSADLMKMSFSKLFFR